MTAGGETHEAAAWSAAIFARRFDVHPARVAGRPDCNLHEPDQSAASRYDDRRCGASERGAVSQEVARARAGDAQSWSCWTPCWLLSPSANSGGGSAVVMVKAVEDGAHQDATGELWRARNGLLLADALVWPCLIVEDDERGEQAPEVLVAKHEDVVEQLPPERAHEALSEGVHVRLAYGAADDLRSGGLEDRCESDTQLPITVSDQDFGLVVHSGIPGLLRAPVVGGHLGGSCVNDLAALEVDEEQDEKRAEESIEGLYEVTAPGDVVLDE